MIDHAARLLVLDRTRVLVFSYLWYYILLPFSTSVWSYTSHRCYSDLPVSEGSRAELYTVRARSI